MKTIFIAHSKRLFCESLCASCISFGLKVIGSSVNGLESLNLLTTLKPDLVLLDTELSYINGLELVRQLKTKKNSPKIILYVGNNSSRRFAGSPPEKVDFLLFEQDSIGKLKSFLLEMNNDERAYQAPSSQAYLEKEKAGPSNDRLNMLTPTQLKVLSLVSTHRTMPQIAEMLYVSPHTVNNHLANIRRKLKLKGRGVVLKYALEVKDQLPCEVL